VNTILIDDRVGSRELLKHFAPSTAELCHLAFGDFTFVGNGVGEEAWMIGVERKTIPDMVNSLSSGRFVGHQLVGLLENYKRQYLILEGRFLATREGLLTYGQRPHGKGMMYRDFVGRLETLTEMTGMRVIHTVDEYDTVARVKALAHWWGRPYGSHKSYKGTYEFTNCKSAELVKAGLVRRWAQCLTGIGYDKALAAEKVFSSARALALGTVAEWKKVEGVGDVLAEKVVKEISKRR
jgi:ERCC4-type nuclease